MIASLGDVSVAGMLDVFVRMARREGVALLL